MLVFVRLCVAAAPATRAVARAERTGYIPRGVAFFPGATAGLLRAALVFVNK